MRARWLAALSLLLAVAFVSLGAVLAAPNAPVPTAAAAEDRLQLIERENALTTTFQGYRILSSNYVDVTDASVLFKGGWDRVHASLKDAGLDLEVATPNDEATFRAAMRLALQLADGKLKPDDLAMTAISGMARSLRDNHTAFIAPQYWSTVQSGRAVQLGFMSVRSPQGLMVYEVMPDLPAAKAGLRPGDVITAIDGQPLNGGVRAGSAREGVPITYKVLRGDRDVEVRIMPEQGKQPTVRSHMLPSGVAYLRVYSFFAPAQQDSVRAYMRELDAQMEALQRTNPAGWVVDMRNNPGGNEYLAAYLSMRLGLTGNLVENRGREGPPSTIKADGKPLNDGRPVALIINESSASAAEMVASAFQDARIGRVYGVKSPGLVDTSRYYTVGGGALQITVARAYTGPSKKRLDKVGVTPDETVAADRMTLVNGGDAQLDRAIAYVLSSAPSVSAAR
jgi:carboxyl-terminal processing protease